MGCTLRPTTYLLCVFFREENRLDEKGEEHKWRKRVFWFFFFSIVISLYVLRLDERVNVYANIYYGNDLPAAAAAATAKKKLFKKKKPAHPPENGFRSFFLSDADSGDGFSDEHFLHRTSA